MYFYLNLYIIDSITDVLHSLLPQKTMNMQKNENIHIDSQENQYKRMQIIH